MGCPALLYSVCQGFETPCVTAAVSALGLLAGDGLEAEVSFCEEVGAKFELEIQDGIGVREERYVVCKCKSDDYSSGILSVVSEFQDLPPVGLVMEQSEEFIDDQVENQGGLALQRPDDTVVGDSVESFRNVEKRNRQIRAGEFGILNAGVECHQILSAAVDWILEEQMGCLDLVGGRSSSGSDGLLILVLKMFATSLMFMLPSMMSSRRFRSLWNKCCRKMNFFAVLLTGFKGLFLVRVDFFAYIEVRNAADRSISIDFVSGVISPVRIESMVFKKAVAASLVLGSMRHRASSDSLEDSSTAVVGGSL
ncbi:hypothetical protein TTRE_0000569601 [Trichuris trichiura]|uniref:Uncharacterized protein n=1 Tax=Trichuris trichiura TaxID=36087 RepID=A0A077ZC31_TRITR|nr:hypothetical protein TTRE_0000569601 [Trichuris trichiura]